MNPMERKAMNDWLDGRIVEPWWNGREWITPYKRALMCHCLRTLYSDEGLRYFNRTEEAERVRQAYGVECLPPSP